MKWVDDLNNKIDNLHLAGFETIEVFEWFWFRVKFKDLSDIEVSSILSYLQDTTKFDILDFLEWIIIRKINLKLSYSYLKDLGLLFNFKALMITLKLKLQIKMEVM
ncbi:hypothetical protein [Tissierella sp.]|uniref:hypothetical protein n=1 Tax=Tissierella sp. TaxID=41274 RepID=UPI00286436BC|nr:hypothetical protein [Tissierella sp.]MDR7856099.1 hypothetical protein [Tissierella sp.]